VNDFDEVAEMPYAVDLVRLVTSAILAERENKLSINAADAAAAVLQGYTEFLQVGGKPFVLEESHANLREMALSGERDPVKFWSKLSSALPVTPPKRVRRLLGSSLPDGTGESPTRTVLPAKEVSAGRAMSRPARATAAWLRVRERHGCPRRGAGPKASRSTEPMRFAS
jgi:hypothetical protein